MPKLASSIAFAIALGATPALAQTTIITREPVQPEVQTQVVVPGAPIVLTPTQRTTIYRTITATQPATVAPEATVSVGARIPGAVPLYEVPQEVAVEVPAVRPLRYMMVNGHVVLVDPATSTVVADLYQ